MGDWGILQGSRYAAGGIIAATSQSEGLNAGSPAHTKGVWSQLIASTPWDSSWMMVEAGEGDTEGNLIDIGIGADGFEQVIIPNILAARGAFFRQNMHYTYWPISIPVGTRISARNQSTASGGGVEVSVILSSGGFPFMPKLGRVVDYGTAAGDSGGTAVDPGGVAHTKGAWSEVIASTTNNIYWLVVVIANAKNTPMTNARWLIDVGIGAGGSEKIVVPDLVVKGRSEADTLYPNAWCFPLQIPKPTRLAVRAQCDITDATDRLFDVALYGVD